MGLREFVSFVLVLLCSSSVGSSQNLSSSQIATLFHIRRALEYPPSMSGWRKATNLCALPNSLSLEIVCSGNEVTDLSISGLGRRLSLNFSIDYLFTTLSRFPNLNFLSLTSLGLWGPVPIQITQFNSLRTLNLSSNFISGKIPLSIFSLPSLRYLNLSKNNLTGELPSSTSCSKSLSVVDLSRNRIMGSLPGCMSSNDSAIQVLVSGNCLSSQMRNPDCPESAIAAVIPPSTSEKKSHKLEFALAIAAGAAAGAFVLALILILKKRRKRTFPKEKLAAVRVSLRLATDERSTPLTGGSCMAPKVFTVEEIEEATDGFSAANLVMDAAIRQVYKGKIQDGSMVVVVKIKLDQTSCSGQRFLQFIDLVSRLRHPNISCVLGYCTHVDSLFIVSDQPSNGTLRSHLTEWRKLQVFKWPQRVVAAVGVARGLRFLHTVTVPGISGNTLTSENILVDQTLAVKIANYNLPALSSTYMSNNGKGGSEFPLLLPENSTDTRIRSGEEGEKDDIYGLGLILLELITGKPFSGKEKLTALKSRLEKALREEGSKLNELVDPTIRDTFAVESIKTVAQLALNCASEDDRRRPPIDDVIWNLQYAVQVQDQLSSDDVS